MRNIQAIFILFCRSMGRTPCQLLRTADYCFSEIKLLEIPAKKCLHSVHFYIGAVQTAKCFHLHLSRHCGRGRAAGAWRTNKENVLKNIRNIITKYKDLLNENSAPRKQIYKKFKLKLVLVTNNLDTLCSHCSHSCIFQTWQSTEIWEMQYRLTLKAQAEKSKNLKSIFM